MNIIATWLYLVGTAANARKLRARLETLKPPPFDPLFGPEARQCPLTVLYGADISRRAYANAALRAALDAWDSGYITTADLRRWCLEIERGRYTGKVFKPAALPVLSRVYPVLKEAH